MTAIFITATGTEVGKTFVAAALIRHLRRMGRSVEAIKPVVSGFDPQDYAASDPAVLLQALGFPATLPNIERVSPWRFRAAMSPDAAARKEDRRIDVDEVVAFCQSAIEQRQDILLIEGIGGVMVPLDDRHTVLDWMVAVNVPVLLVTGSYLGTLSHTLTACEVLARAGLTLRAIVLNDTGDGAVPLSDTRATLQRFVRDVSIVTIPRVKSWLGAKAEFALLARSLFDE